MTASRFSDGGLIDRTRPLSFTFNGKNYSGFEGDTLASALLANGVKVVGRSFKYHRPRGVFTAGEEEPCALVETGSGASRIPTCRAPLVQLQEGLVANSQNAWPSVNFDLGRIVDYTHNLWPAGFYNKTFKWPNWHTWEGMIRRSAGLGRPLSEPDPDHYEQVNAHCDVLVCGGGPAGLLAALAAGRAGLRVILAEQAVRLGGCLVWEQYQLDGKPALTWVNTALAELKAMTNVILLQSATVSGVYDHNVTTVLQQGTNTAWRECLWTIRPKRIFLATGAIEQGLIFPDNDRPGIMLAGAVRHYLNRFAVLPGKNIVIVTNNDSAYQTVFDLALRQQPVSVVIDSRAEVDPALKQRLEKLGTRLLTNARIHGTSGSKGIRSVCIEDNKGNDLGRWDCDLLAASGGWAARVHLLAHARGALRFDEYRQSFLPGHLPAGFTVAGSVNGTPDLARTFNEALSATVSVCESLGTKAALISAPDVSTGIAESTKVEAIRLDEKRPRQWIDLAHDVTFGDAELAVREGYVSVEHFKRYTTTGMSVDQGKTGNLNAFIVLGKLTGRETGDIGTTTYRPPYSPVTLGAVAGRRCGEFYAPRRVLPAQTVHEKLDAEFEDYGWQRPDCYPRAGESPTEAIQREAKAVRTHVGVFDNSPIGKLEVRGPDAAECLSRLYINNVRTLAPGRARYGLMLNEHGVIIDDGVFVRLTENHFVVHTTSGAVARIYAMMEEWLQCEWRNLRVVVDDMTAQSANFAVAGPKAREVLLALGTDIDLSSTTLPHMAVATGSLAGLDVRILRVSYSGEAGFEINVAARYGAGMLEAILEAGQPFGIVPYGVEALMLLRTEKGYLHIGTDTDGETTPDDVGWGHVARNKPDDYIGKRSLYRAGNTDHDRKQFMGLELLDPKQIIRPGAHLLLGENRQPPATTDGWVTSACFSPNLGRYIALCRLRSGTSRKGEIVTVCDEDERFHARVVSPVFYDPENLRLGRQ